MSFINWGGESPEQRAIRARIEQEALYEQAVRMAQARNAQQMGGAAGGSNANVSKVAGTIVFTSTGVGTGNFQFNSFNFDDGSFGKTYDSGVDASFYYYDNSYVVHDKGYMFVFRGNVDNNDYALVFTGAEGNVLRVDTGSTFDLTTNYSQGKWLYAYDYDARVVWYSDGVNVTKNETLLAGSDDFVVGTNGVDSTANGLSIHTITEVGSPAQNRWDFYQVATPSSTPTLVLSDLVDTNISFEYSHQPNSTKIIKEEYDDLNNEYLSLTIHNSDGSIYQSIDLTTSPGGYNAGTRYTYGTGKYLWVFRNNYDYLVVQYDSVNDYLYTANHDRVDYPEFYVTDSDSYFPGDFDDSEDSENAMVSFYRQTFQDYNLTVVDGCDFLLFFGNSAPTLVTYDDVSSLETRGVYFGEANALSDTIVVPCATDAGNISIVTISPTGVSENDLGSPGYSIDDYYVEGNWLNGSRLLYSIGTKASPGDTNFIMLDSDGVTQLGETLTIETTDYNLSRDYDTVYIQVNANEISSGWYFKNDSSEWTEVGYFDGYDEPNGYYQSGIVTSPGNMVLARDADRIYWFNDVPAYNQEGTEVDIYNVIDDGGNDMYDGGNYLNTNLGSEIAYTHTQMTRTNDLNEGDEATIDDFIMDGEVLAGSNINFGVGSSYFTNLYPGLFVLSVDNPSITSFSVTGGLGSDENNFGGDYDKITTTHNSKTYTYYWKREWQSVSQGSSEPSVNHLIIIDSDGNDILHDAAGYNDNNGDDYHEISNDGPGDMPINKLHYLVFSKFNRIKVSDQELASIVNSYLNVVDPIGSSPTFAQTLTLLNVNYTNVTANLPSHDEVADIRVLSPSTESSFTVPLYDNMRIGRNRVLFAYQDAQRDYKISARLYDFNGTLLNTVDTDQYDTWSTQIVGDKAFFITDTKGYDSELDLVYVDYYFYRITDTGVKSKKIRVPASDSDFYWEVNDFNFWND